MKFPNGKFSRLMYTLASRIFPVFNNRGYVKRENLHKLFVFNNLWSKKRLCRQIVPVIKYHHWRTIWPTSLTDV